MKKPKNNDLEKELQKTLAELNKDIPKPRVNETWTICRACKNGSPDGYGGTVCALGIDRRGELWINESDCNKFDKAGE